MKAPMKYKLVDIKVITVSRNDYLSKEILSLINSGWQRESGIVITESLNSGTMYSQVMVKYEQL